MKMISASDVRPPLDELLDALENDRATSVLIQRDGRPVAILLDLLVAEKVILCAYAQGVLPRSVAMQQLGIDWYGDLLLRLNAHGIKRPEISVADAERMKKSVEKALGAVMPPAKTRGRKPDRST